MGIGAGQRRTDRRHPPTLGLCTLLAERHNVPGGCATSFRRGRFEFETALHQLSGVGLEVQPYTLRGLFEKLGVADSLLFVPEHDLYRAVVPGRHDVTLPADWAGAVDVLEDAFPTNRARVERFFALARDVTEPSRHTTSTPGCSRSQASSLSAVRSGSTSIRS